MNKEITTPGELYEELCRRIMPLLESYDDVEKTEMPFREYLAVPGVRAVTDWYLAEVRKIGY